MSYQLSPSADRGALPSGRVMPPGEEVASFATYAEAQHAVDSLSDEGFPVQYLAIVGTDLRQVENITGRMSWGRAVASGVGSGLWIGLFFGAMLSFLGPSRNSGAVSFAAAVIMGVVWGVLFQVIAYALTRGRRDFTSTSSVVASRYSIIAAREARAAAQSLAATPGNLSRGGEAARRAEERRRARLKASDGPTAFGSRPDEQPRFGVRVPEGEDPAAYARGGAGEDAADESAAGAADAAAGEDAAGPAAPSDGKTPDA
ncbi:general stress protein [uncultured Actinomyces sp.]|uniref:general stress protein n=1 Tax=uncultured Actinomyces sp. TaxID=249061 RepID=UPI00288BD4DC|nr:general stress protein [uncultured Actinomyces sp.]